MADTEKFLTELERTLGLAEQELAGSEADRFPQALNQILAHFDCVVGTIHERAESGLLELVAERGIPEAIRERVSRIPIGKGMAGLAAERQEPVQVCNLQTDDSGDVRPGAKSTKMEGSIALPIIVDGEVVGTFGVAKPTEYEFSAAEISLLEEVGARIARAFRQ